MENPTHTSPPSKGNINLQLKEAAKLLREGEVVAFPTETVYGLGASLQHEKAIRRIFTLKGRPQDNPLIVHVALKDLFVPIPEILKQFWPGPLTVVVPYEGLPSCVTAGLPTVAIRVPNHPIALTLLEKTGPLVAPSANLSGKPSPTTAAHVHHDLEVPVLDGGACEIGLESTILSLVGKPTILRPGAITAKELSEALGEEVVLSQSSEALAPGMKYRHYAPEGQLFLFKTEEALQKHLSVSALKRRVVKRGIERNQLYNFLRECDLQKAEEILLVVSEQLSKDAAFINRIQKAIK
ncbi:MAG: threonylcarbamoyl-AMP synthase [Chlamydiales bacterium]|nr:threonylcarbamoyl-AMP synthase [Chlamydiales bacterium]